MVTYAMIETHKMIKKTRALSATAEQTFLGLEIEFTWKSLK